MNFLKFLQKMLARVEYRGVQKYIKVPQNDENFDFLQFLQAVTDKFSLQAESLNEGLLSLTDTSGTEVDADIFDELIKSGIQNFKIGYCQYPVSDLEVCLVADETQSSVLPGPSVSPVSLPASPVSTSDRSASPASSASTASTVILSSTKNRKRGLGDLDRDEARQENSTHKCADHLCTRNCDPFSISARSIFKKMDMNITMIQTPILATLLGDSRQSNATALMAPTDVPGLICRTAQQPIENPC
ncbi:uncharacterized protein LOC121724134 [Alosa sapidissima]|uniref:uncharacterized protein LOC121724134 n=1 Tax=Alosa sapidissima TaxID=34773 RepID=UPI001C086C71|nr:uncharacterized protein LOC121724134 [Alosa sapidissima]